MKGGAAAGIRAQGGHGSEGSGQGFNTSPAQHTPRAGPLTPAPALHRHALLLLHQLRLRLRHHLRLLLLQHRLLWQHAALHHHGLLRLRRQAVLLLRLRLLLQDHGLLLLHRLRIGGSKLLLLQNRLLGRLHSVLLLHRRCCILRLQGLLLRLHGGRCIALTLLRLQHARCLLLRAGQQLLRNAWLLLQQVLQEAERLLLRARLLQAAHALGTERSKKGGQARAQGAGPQASSNCIAPAPTTAHPP